MPTRGVKQVETHVGQSTVFIDSNKIPIRNPNKYPATGNTRLKRTIVERETDLLDVARLYIEGNTQAQIADIISEASGKIVGRDTVHNTIQEIFKRWEMRYVDDVNFLKMRELVKIDKLESTYWEAWQRSSKDFKSEETVEKGGTLPSKSGHSYSEDGKRGYVGKSKRKVVEERVGNVKFLQGIERCVELRMKILEIGNVRHVNINWRKQAEEAGFNPDKVVDGFIEQFVDAAIKDGESK